MKTKILLSIIAILFVTVLYLLYLNFIPKTNIVYNSVPAVNQISTPPVSETPSQNNNWKTYINTKLNFSFKYPNTIDVEETNNYANIPGKWGLTAKINGKFYFSIEEHNNNGYFDEAVKTSLKFGTNSFVYFNEPGLLDGSYIYDLDKKIEIIASTKDQHINDKRFEQILSTFKFTSVTSNWKTYTNTSLGFSFEYPQEYSIEDSISPGESGQAFNLSITDGKTSSILLGGITSDYSAGRGGSFTDTQGYRLVNNDVFVKFVNTSEIPVLSPLLQSVSQNSNLVQIVRVVGQSTSYGTSRPGDPGKGNFGAFINLPNKPFTGISLVNYPDNHLLTSAQFDHILSTFKFTK